MNILNIFDERLIPLDDWIQGAVDWLVTNFRDEFQTMKLPIEWTLDGVNVVLHWVPPLVMLVIFALLAWRTAGWRVALFTAVSLALVGFLGLWGDTMTTLAMVISAVVFCVVVGVPVGILSARSEAVASFVRPILDVMQTTPAFVYLVPVVMLFSIGTVAGVIATIVFAMPPLIRLTALGIQQVQEDAIEAATAFGSTSNQILWKVQMPLAMPTIMAGLNQTIMLSLSMVVIAALIGAGGLGNPVFRGLNTLNVGLAGIGGLGIVLLAIVLDRITQGLGKPPERRRAS
ncbi:MAG TPA: proline/glycine betaine ABC transporter permease [Trueperaceae bacterium]